MGTLNHGHNVTDLTRHGLDDSILNREMIDKMALMSQVIKDLSQENEKLKLRKKQLTSGVNPAQIEYEEKLGDFEKKFRREELELESKIKNLQKELEKHRGNSGTSDKLRYKTLSRKLKEERNLFRNILQVNILYCT